MFNIFKNVIETSDFDLRDILNKIEESYIMNVFLIIVYGIQMNTQRDGKRLKNE